MQQVPRSRNSHADSLATLATSSRKDLPRIILVEDLVRHVEREVMKVRVFQIKVGPSWMDPIVSLLKEGVLPLKNGEVEKIHRKAPYFQLSEEHKLYKHSFLGLYFVSISRQWSHFWKNCMKEYIEVIHGANHCHIGLLLRIIGGRACRKRHKSMLKNVISAKSLLQTFISLGVC